MKLLVGVDQVTMSHPHCHRAFIDIPFRSSSSSVAVICRGEGEMFRLPRHRNRSSEKLGKRVEFNFSDLHVPKVPKGWERLMVSIVGVDSGKTVAKSRKGVVRNGSCQWSDVLRESVVVSHQEDEQFLYRIVVSMGSMASLRHGVLGEALLNLIDYMKQKDPSPISLKLEKCNQDTVLQVKVECFSPETNSRVRKHSVEALSIGEEDPDVVDIDDNDVKSDESDSMLYRSVVSFSSSHLEECGNRSMSASESHHSSDSSEILTAKTKISPKNSMNGGGAYNNSVSSQNGGGDNVLRSSHSSFNSKTNNNGHTSSLRHSDSSSEYLEAAQETIEELRGESRMWEKTARKLKGDNEALQKELSDHSKHCAELDLERDALKLEVDKMKVALDESLANQSKFELSKIQQEGAVHRKKEWEDEIRFQKESQTSLAHQLKKTQESNIELLTILQELEETIEKQRQEIANSSPPNNDTDANLEKEVESLKSKIQELERDCAELTEENFKLAVTMKETMTTRDVVNAETSFVSRSNSQLQFEQESEKMEIPIEGVDTETALTIRFHELEKKCNDLELDLQFFKDKANDLGVKLQRSLMELEKQSIDLVGLQQEWENQRDSGVAAAKKLEVENVKLSQCLSGSERKFQDLSALLDASKQSEEILKEDIEDMSKSMEDAKLREEQLKKTVNGLELKIKASEYEREQLKEETSNLKSQLQEIPDLQGEILVLESTLDKVSFENSKLENSLHSVTHEYEKIKAENNSCMEKFYEDAKLLGGGKASPEALDTQDAEIKNEIDRIKRENSQYQRKIDCLEEEKDTFTKKVQELEKELKLQREIDKEQFQGNNGIHLESKVQKLESELAQALLTIQKSSIRTGSVDSKSSSSLEVELKDVEERYLQMSLRYAEVEAQREDLVMKLKSFKKEKSWFS